jgi:hypothetical protein
MPTPRFVKFCRRLALVGGPMTIVGPLTIPSFVEGCSSDVMRCQGPCGGSSFIEDTLPNDAGYGESGDASPPRDTADGAEGDTSDVVADGGDGGPRDLPDLPFFGA